MKKFLCATAGLVIAGGVVTSASAQTKWDMPTPYGDASFQTKNTIQFAADVEKATNGTLKIAVHSGGSLIKHADIKSAVGQGKAPIGEILGSLAASQAPVYGVDSVPFLATSHEAAKKLYAAQKPALEKQLASEGLMLLYSVPWPPQGIYAKREITKIEDFKGLKFRTYNAMTERIAALVGATSSQIEIPDLPAAVAEGKLDVMISSPLSSADVRVNYFTYFIDTQASLPRNIVFVNKAAFDKLSATEKKALLDAAKVAEERGWKLSMEEMTTKIEALKASGIKVVAPSIALRNSLHAIGGTLASEWIISAGAAGGAILVEYKKP